MNDYLELDSKKQQLMNLKLKSSKTHIKKLSDFLTVELTYTSNFIEGNTLTRAETQAVIEYGTAPAGKKIVEVLEARNHAKALDYVLKEAENKEPLNELVILKTHELLTHGILEPTESGIYRNRRVFITGSSHVPPNPLKVPDLMTDLINWYKEQKRLLHPIELAAEFHYKLVSIHPFLDGNGRTSRLMMNYILINNDFPPTVIGVDDQERISYLHALRDSDHNNFNSFMDFVKNAVERSLNSQLEYYEL
jgi:Fic family protein